MTDVETYPVLPECPPIVFSGADGEITDADITIDRLNTCYSCEELIVDSMLCKQTGCLMTSKVKLAVSSCPLDKW